MKENQNECGRMIKTGDVLRLIEANRIMSGLIERLYAVLLQVATVEEIEQMDILPDISKAAEIMKDYE